MQQPSPYIPLSDEVQTALQAQQPVVALESTVIAHGLPYPANIEVAQAMESIIRAEGAIPETIGIHDGQINIGLTLEQITRLGTAQNVQKVTRRDLTITLATKQLGATTGAGTMLWASMPGIRSFATGGACGRAQGEPPHAGLCVGRPTPQDNPRTPPPGEAAPDRALGRPRAQALGGPPPPPSPPPP